MNRRTFLQTTLLAAGAAALPLKFNAEEEPWDAFLRSLRPLVAELAERGYDIRLIEIRPEEEISGVFFRRVAVRADCDGRSVPDIRWWHPADAGAFPYTLRPYTLSILQHQQFRPPAGFSVTNCAAGHRRTFAGKLYERKLRCLGCERNELDLDSEQVALVAGRWMLVEPL
jgi:hypothetical protein